MYLGIKPAIQVLSLVIPPWLGAMGTSQRSVMLCSWAVKAGMVREWVTGKAV